MTQFATPSTINAAALMKLLEVHPIPGSVYAVNSPDAGDIAAVASDHYGTDADGFMSLLDPSGPRTKDAFCLAWWGKPYAQCFNEILLTERFVQWIRQSSDHEDPAGSGSFYLNYLGGDTLDTCVVTQSGFDNGRRFWVGSDYYINGPNAVDLATNEFISGALPNRNHMTNEFKNGEVDKWGATRSADALGAGFRTMAGPNLTPAFRPNQTTYPNTLYWNLAVSPSLAPSRVLYVGAWLTTFPGGGGALDHQVEDSHILHINGFGTVSETATFNVGPGSNFYICDIVEDTSFDYVYGREFVPKFGNFTPNYFEDEATITSYMTVARTPHGSLMSTAHVGGVFSTYQFWNGTAWISSIASLARLKDTNGNDIAGDAGVAKLGTNNYILVAQDYLEREKRCYRSTIPEGPWDHYITIPAPPFGLNYFGVGEHRGQLHTKIHPDFPAPDGHVMTMAAPLSAATPGRHILDGGTSYFLAVPEPGFDINPPVISAPATLNPPVQVQLVIQNVQMPVITIPALIQEPTHLLTVLFTVPSITATATVQSPTITLNQATISPNVINAAAILYSPSVFNVITLIRSTAAISDDAYEEPGHAPVINNIDIVANIVGMRVGLRFNDVQIPMGANVVTSTVDLVLSQGTSKNDAEGIWYGEDVDNALTFTTTDGNLDNRVTTNASALWTDNDLGGLGAVVTSSDLSLIVEEIIARPGWTSGNSLVLIYDHNSAVDKLQFASFENVTYDAPKLTVNYLSSATVLTPASITAIATMNAPSIAAVIDPGVITVVTSMQTPALLKSLQDILLSKIDAGAFLFAPTVVNASVAAGISVTFRDPINAAGFIDPDSSTRFIDPLTTATFAESHTVTFQE